jgi:hypothetical protein
MERYKIVNFFTGRDTGLTVNSMDEARQTIIKLEKESTDRYIPLGEQILIYEDEDEETDEIH